jgi:ribosome-associated heat shock protein Hsp15
MGAPPPTGLRVDKWLWHARFCKTRATAQRKVEPGLIRLNGQSVEKPSALVRPGDVLTLPIAGEVIVLRVLALGTRRGPPAEARALYERLRDA